MLLILYEMRSYAYTYFIYLSDIKASSSYVHYRTYILREFAAFECLFKQGIFSVFSIFLFSDFYFILCEVQYAWWNIYGAAKIGTWLNQNAWGRFRPHKRHTVNYLQHRGCKDLIKTRIEFVLLSFWVCHGEYLLCPNHQFFRRYRLYFQCLYFNSPQRVPGSFLRFTIYMILCNWNVS